MTLKAECQASLDAFKTIVKGNVSSGSAVLKTILEDPQEAAITPPVLMVFDDGLDWTAPPGQWRKVLWDWRLQLFIQQGSLEAAAQQCRDMRGDLMELMMSHLTLNATCQTVFWKVAPKLVKLSWSGIDYAGIDGILTVRFDDAFTYAA